jgi:hypothetical protein
MRDDELDRAHDEAALDYAAQVIGVDRSNDELLRKSIAYQCRRLNLARRVLVGEIVDAVSSVLRRLQRR